MLARVDDVIVALTTGLLVQRSCERSQDSVTRVPPSTGSRTYRHTRPPRRDPSGPLAVVCQAMRRFSSSSMTVLRVE